ncbi:MAG: hypothetical protein HOO86_04755 [Bacteroidales bacterium]|nr:hypothetical protein [Bacteroidales bacterium]
MKKLIILILALIPVFSSCKKDNETDSTIQIREIAWISLSEHERSTVIVDWKQAPVTETIYKEKKAYAVVFKTSDDALLGPITVYVDSMSKIVLGQNLRF